MMSIECLKTKKISNDQLCQAMGKKMTTMMREIKAMRMMLNLKL